MVIYDLKLKKVCVSSYSFSFFQVIPTDKSGDFDMIYGFLRENWSIVRWAALGIVIFEVNQNLFDWVFKRNQYCLVAS